MDQSEKSSQLADKEALYEKFLEDTAKEAKKLFPPIYAKPEPIKDISFFGNGMLRANTTPENQYIQTLFKEVDGQKFYNYCGTWYRLSTPEERERFLKQRKDLKEYDKKIERFYKAMDILECDLLDLYNKKKENNRDVVPAREWVKDPMPSINMWWDCGINEESEEEEGCFDNMNYYLG